MVCTSSVRQRYDLVVGADGMHSATRRLTFGPEAQFLQHLGFYVALADLPGVADPNQANPMYNFPGHMIGIATYDDKALAVFTFRFAMDRLRLSRPGCTEADFGRRVRRT